uniref:Uncharacterized protein n=1 Tax=Amphiprion percula TaxID=161767 RepID=A0A3P8TVV6_AMPPE
MDVNSPAHRGCFFRERLLETGVPQMDCCLQARNSVPQNLNDLSGALQEEWDAMPQQTISRLVDSMRRRCQDAVDTQDHMTSY